MCVVKSILLNTQCLRGSRTLKITTNDINNIDVDIEGEGSFCNFSGSVISCRSKEKEVLYFYLQLIKNYYYFLIIILVIITITIIGINLLVVYRESVNLIGYITRRLSADSLQL